MELGKVNCSHCRRSCSAMLRLVWEEGKGGRRKGGREGGREEVCKTGKGCVTQQTWKTTKENEILIACDSLVVIHFDILAVGFLEQFFIV